ncbi:hypothetical protein J3R30DRAFT_1014520 [Lentinula aciculospora]|uniref:Uncharacterized protein n=1 Tax=Lentinula aciculospora TaxID=153920 RepID=A0A9W9A1N8_9AGAR|nr:hypothetical protein J3R30DRAFT_1014520 [Lentinula aciculospora]
MRCNWFTKASCISNSLSRPLQKIIRPSFVPRYHFTNRLPVDHLPKAFAFVSHRFVSTSAQRSTTSDTFDPLLTGTNTNIGRDLTATQLSRAVWHSVRLALQAQDLHTAYIIVESARLSNKPLLHNVPSKRYRASGIEFRNPVSTRLAGHALVHGLLRLGLPRRAQVAAKILMDNGIHLNTKTFEALLEALVISDGATPRSSGNEFLNLLKTLLPKSSILSLNPTLSGGKGSRAALHLFMSARNLKQQQRTDRMYRTLIRSFLFHGELIAASLLITIILKDCAVRDAIGRQLASPDIKEDPKVEQQSLEHYRFLRRSSPSPPFDILRDLVASIAEVLSRDLVEDDAYQISFQAALQTLANLAYLLDIRQIPFSHLSSLVRLLYDCPRSDDLVWIVKTNGEYVQINAYRYFHHVLERLVRNPPRLRDKLQELKPTTLLTSWKPILDNSRPLDLPACNSLLHYALRHRLSPNHADNILQYMQDPFWKNSGYRRPIPNTVTYNIILSAGRLLRSPIMVETVLRMFQHINERGLGTIHLDLASTALPANLDATQGTSNDRFSSSLRRLASESHELSLPYPATTKKLVVDTYILTSYISYLVSVGRADVVPDILFGLLPQLAIVDHPSWGDLQPEQIKRLRQQSRTDCLRQVVAYGPYFLVSILNAVVKCGRTGLAERIWYLSKEAERASWLPEFNQGHEPWCLPVHAYTLMLICYGNEARKHHNPVPSTAIDWQPRSSRYVIGWAHFIVQESTRSRQPLDRSVAGRRYGITIYQSMLRGARSVYQALRVFESSDNETAIPWKNLKFPAPDERFFNAMLRIVSNGPGKRTRRVRTTPSHWKQHIRFANWLYRKHGQSQHQHNTDLLLVAEDMVKAGFELPIGVRYMLTGQHSQELRQRERKREASLDRSPWAYPVAQAVHTPFALHVEKQKGLPLGRIPKALRRWKRTWRSRKRGCTSVDIGASGTNQKKVEVEVAL